MYKQIKTSFPVTVFRKDKDGNLIGARVVDQFPAQDFNIGANGFVSNDISVLARAQSEQEFQLILNRLKEYKVNNPDTSGLTDREIIQRFLIPANIQSPAEIERYVNWYNRLFPVDKKAVPEPAPVSAPEPAPAE